VTDRLADRARSVTARARWGKACLSTKAETRRCLVDNVPGAPDVIRRVHLTHCASSGDWAGSTATS